MFSWLSVGGRLLRSFGERVDADTQSLTVSVWLQLRRVAGPSPYRTRSCPAGLKTPNDLRYFSDDSRYRVPMDWLAAGLLVRAVTLPWECRYHGLARPAR